MNHLRLLAAAAAVAGLLVGCTGASDSSEASTDANIEEASAAFALLNVRSGPGFTYPIVYQVPGGTALDIQCYTNDPSGNIWYQLGDGNYILASAAGPGNYPSCVGVGMPAPEDK